MKVISKKHWFSYTMNFCIILFICFPAIYLYLNYREKLISPIWKYSIPITIAYVIYQNIRSIILNSRTKWIFDEDVLILKSGLLPWRRTNFSFDIDQIYDIFYDKSFLGTLLNYGQLSVRRTDGVTSKFSYSKMTNPKKMVQVVSTAIGNKKSSSSAQTVQTTKLSTVDELQRLADLHTAGKITDHEFQKLKENIFNHLER